MWNLVTCILGCFHIVFLHILCLGRPKWIIKKGGTCPKTNKLKFGYIHGLHQKKNEDKYEHPNWFLSFIWQESIPTNIIPCVHGWFGMILFDNVLKLKMVLALPWSLEGILFFPKVHLSTTLTISIIKFAGTWAWANKRWVHKNNETYD